MASDVEPCTSCDNDAASYSGMTWFPSSVDSATTSWSGNETWTTTDVPPLLSRYSVWYAAYHGYVSLAVCAVGIVGNSFNVVVLTRRVSFHFPAYAVQAAVLCGFTDIFVGVRLRSSCVGFTL